MPRSSWLGSHPNPSGSRNRDLFAHLVWGTQPSKLFQSTCNALKTRQDKAASGIAWPFLKRNKYYWLTCWWLQKFTCLEAKVQGILTVESSRPWHLPLRKLPCLSAHNLCWDRGFSSFLRFEVVSLCRKERRLHWDRDKMSFNCITTCLETWETEGDSILSVLVIVS